MERTKIDGKQPEKTLDFILTNAFGIPIISDSVPTLADMKANSWVKNSTNIYIKFSDNAGIKLSGSSFS